MESKYKQTAALGQSLWLDFISREILQNGELANLAQDGLMGVTSNPTIFQKSIAAGSLYDEQLEQCAANNLSPTETFEAIAIADVGAAADIFRNVYEETGGRDGFVSIEVNPHLAHDTDGTVAEARRLFSGLNRPNIMVKVPATDAGLPAITTLIGEGINVNVTLIFARAMYERVMDAFLAGLAQLRANGGDLSKIASVASFFVSRVDGNVDDLVRAKLNPDDPHRAALLGQAALANAKLAYQQYKAKLEAAPFAEFAKAGARPQRPLWASTSTKDPDYSDTLYIDNLIGPNTVNTAPLDTLEAFKDHGVVAQTIEQDLDHSHTVLNQLAEAGVNMDAVTDELLDEGVRKFTDSFDALIDEIKTKRDKLKTSA